ncbi:MAG: OmpH family outer membrane protein [Bacteroidales bacterium]|jgi:outer membrane protein|nr:OmpH family outer membrane protein [Bacteroidales bacterium]
MKKLDLVLTLEAALLAAVVVLFILFFKGNKGGSSARHIDETDTVGITSVNAVADGTIVYINTDSLFQNYQMAIDLSEELAEKTKKLDAELSNRQKKFQANVTDFQNKAQKGLETRAKLAEMEQQLAVDRDNLLQLNDTYRMQIAEEQAVMQRKVLQALMDYLKEYNHDKGYQFIMGRAFGDNLLFASPGLDVTMSVLEGINARYKVENPPKTAK